jgi:hypothetical protein
MALSAEEGTNDRTCTGEGHNHKEYDCGIHMREKLDGLKRESSRVETNPESWETCETEDN